MAGISRLTILLALITGLACPVSAQAYNYDELILMVQAEEKVFGRGNYSESLDRRLVLLEKSVLGQEMSGSDSYRLRSVARALGLAKPQGSVMAAPISVEIKKEAERPPAMSSKEKLEIKSRKSKERKRRLQKAPGRDGSAQFKTVADPKTVVQASSQDPGPANTNLAQQNDSVDKSGLPTAPAYDSPVPASPGQNKSEQSIAVLFGIFSIFLGFCMFMFLKDKNETSFRYHGRSCLSYEDELVENSEPEIQNNDESLAYLNSVEISTAAILDPARLSPAGGEFACMENRVVVPVGYSNERNYSVEKISKTVVSDKAEINTVRVSPEPEEIIRTEEPDALPEYNTWPKDKIENQDLYRFDSMHVEDYSFNPQEIVSEHKEDNVFDRLRAQDPFLEFLEAEADLFVNLDHTGDPEFHPDYVGTTADSAVLPDNFYNTAQAETEDRIIEIIERIPALLSFNLTEYIENSDCMDEAEMLSLAAALNKTPNQDEIATLTQEWPDFELAYSPSLSTVASFRTGRLQKNSVSECEISGDWGFESYRALAQLLIEAAEHLNTPCLVGEQNVACLQSARAQNEYEKQLRHLFSEKTIA